MKKKEIVVFRWMIYTFSIIAIVMIVIYFVAFNGGLSTVSEHWGDFGSYFSSITGLLAFVGVLYTLHISSKQNEILQVQNNDSTERDFFFKMLDLHNDKVRNIEIGNTNGVDALSDCVLSLNLKLAYVIVYKLIDRLLDNGKSFQEIEQMFYCYNINGSVVYNMIESYKDSSKVTHLSKDQKWKRIKAHLEYNQVPCFAGELPSLIIINILNLNIEVKELSISTKDIADSLYIV